MEKCSVTFSDTEIFHIHEKVRAIGVNPALLGRKQGYISRGYTETESTEHSLWSDLCEV